MNPAAPSTEPIDPTRASAAGPTVAFDRAEFLAKISHAIRTPLTSIIGFSQLLRDRVGEDDGPSPEVAELLEIVERNALRLERLVSELILLGRLSDPDADLEVEDIDVAELVTEACARAEGQARRVRLHLVTTVEDGAPVRGNRTCLLEALGELLGNAVTYSAPGGEVRTTARCGPRGWVIEIDDDGPGIAPDDLAHVFDPFHRGDEAARSEMPGAGLGLAIAAAVAQLHDGDVTLTSTVGLGTQLRLSLPTVR